MKIAKILALLVACIVLAGSVASVSVWAVRGSRQITQSSEAGRPDRIQVMGEDGVVEIEPIMASRTGDLALLDSLGRWDLERMGYADLELPCDNRYEAISAEYALPNNAAQGPETWYLLNYELEIEFGEESENGWVEVSAMTNGAVCSSLYFFCQGQGKSLAIQWGESPTQLQAAPSLDIIAGGANYLRDADLWDVGVKPGLNSLTFRLAQHDGAIVKALRVSSSTSIEITTAVPRWLNLQEQACLSQLPEAEVAEARRIVMNDPVVKQLLDGRAYTITAIAPWALPVGCGNARVDVMFQVPQQIGLDWPWPPTPVRQIPLTGTFWVRTFTIAVDLDNDTVTGISPSAQPWNSTADSEDASKLPALTEDEKAAAKKIALADPRVRETTQWQGIRSGSEIWRAGWRHKDWSLAYDQGSPQDWCRAGDMVQPAVYYYL